MKLYKSYKRMWNVTRQQEFVVKCMLVNLNPTLTNNQQPASRPLNQFDLIQSQKLHLVSQRSYILMEKMYKFYIYIQVDVMWFLVMTRVCSLGFCLTVNGTLWLAESSDCSNQIVNWFYVMLLLVFRSPLHANLF